MNIMISRVSVTGAFPRRRLVPTLTVALSAAVLFLAGCGGGKGSIAGKEPVKNVIKVGNNMQALGAWTERKAKASVLVHIDPADDLTVFARANAESMANAAAHLKRHNVEIINQIAPLIENGGTVNLGYMAGMYDRVIWVVPSRQSVGEASVDAYKNFFLANRNFPATEVAGFRKEGANIVGTVAGVPLTITRFADLSIGENETAIIDLDIAYFPAMKLEDRNYRTGMKTLLNFLRELGAKGIRTNLVTVNLSTQSSMIPIDVRYFGDVIVKALTDPETVTGPVPPVWSLMIQAEDSLLAKRYAAAEALYSEAITIEKNDPGLYFARAIAQGYQNKGSDCRVSLLGAYNLDNEYLRGFFQLARVLADAEIIDAGIEIIDTPELANIIGAADLDYQRGLFFYTAHRPFDAITYLANVARQRPKEFGLFTILFRAYRDAGDVNGQRFSLQKLIAIDEARVRREMPWVFADLGQIYDAQGYYGNAGELYAKYIEASPGDSLSQALQKKLDGFRAKGLLNPAIR